MISLKSPRNAPLMGIVFDGELLKAVVLRRTGSGVRVHKSVQTPLSLNPHTGDSELAGREIRNTLTVAGIHESNCVVCVPLKWALVQTVALPALSESDTNAYMRLQAEREFPFPSEDLASDFSISQTPGGERSATMVAIPKSRVAALQETLRAARLKPLSITIGVASLDRSAGAPGQTTAVLLTGEDGIDLAVFAGGGLAALRNLEQVYAENRDEGVFDVASIARQLRITLGQLPPGVRESIGGVEVYGPSDLTELLLQNLPGALRQLGLTVERGSECQAAGGNLDADAAHRHSAPALCSAARWLQNRPPALEFLPPRTSRLQQLSGRFSSRRTLWLGGAVAAVLLSTIGAFSYQYWRLSNLEAQWSAIEPNVLAVETLQERVRKYRAWFDDSVRSLVITNSLVEAFPQDGAVWAKTVEINENTDVSCSGFARSNQEWLDTLDRIQANQQIEALQVQQVRGEDPIQFTLSFRWSGGSGNGS